MCGRLDFVDFRPVKSCTQDLIRDFLVNSISLGKGDLIPGIQQYLGLAQLPARPVKSCTQDLIRDFLVNSHHSPAL